MRIAIVSAILVLVGVLAGQYIRSHEKRCSAMSQDILRDWPQLGRYRASNEALLAQPLAVTPVVFLGDSVTYLWNLKAFFPNKPYINRGIEGQTSAQMLARFRADVLALHPRQVVIQAGANDIDQQMSLEWTTDNLTTMAELAHNHGIRVIFLSVLPVYDTTRHKRTATHPLNEIRRINQWLQSYAANNGGLYVDCFKEVAEADGILNRAFSNDGLHPNAEGYRIMAALVQAAIDRADPQ